MQVGTIKRGWSYEATIPYMRPSSLTELHGPTSGVVTVAANITTASVRAFDLSDETMRRWLYEQTVRDGVPDQQVDILNRGWLVELWPELNLPDRCRAEWEAAFAELVG